MSAGGGTNVKGVAFIGGNIPTDLHERLKATAAANERTVAQELRVAIKAHVETHESNGEAA